MCRARDAVMLSYIYCIYIYKYELYVYIYVLRYYYYYCYTCFLASIDASSNCRLGWLVPLVVPGYDSVSSTFATNEKAEFDHFEMIFFLSNRGYLMKHVTYPCFDWGTTALYDLVKQNDTEDPPTWYTQRQAITRQGGILVSWCDGFSMASHGMLLTKLLTRGTPNWGFLKPLMCQCHQGSLGTHGAERRGSETFPEEWQVAGWNDSRFTWNTQQ